MTRRVARDVLSAIDDGLEITLTAFRAHPTDLPDVNLRIVLDLDDGRRLSRTARIPREELLTGTGDLALSYAIAVGADAIRKAPRP